MSDTTYPIARPIGDLPSTGQWADPFMRLDLAMRRTLVVGMDNERLYTLQCNYEFEPHGLASEDWEVVYRLTLPVRYCWKSTTGWRVGDREALPLSFKARTANAVVDKALEFFAEWEDHDSER